MKSFGDVMRLEQWRALEDSACGRNVSSGEGNVLYVVAIPGPLSVCDSVLLSLSDSAGTSRVPSHAHYNGVTLEYLSGSEVYGSSTLVTLSTSDIHEGSIVCPHSSCLLCSRYVCGHGRPWWPYLVLEALVTAHGLFCLL